MKINIKKTLLLTIFLFKTCVVYAGTISVNPFISNNDVTIPALENFRSTVCNAINGGLEGGTNIKAASLVSKDMSDAVSIVKFRDEAFNDFTFSGMLPVTSASLTSNISAGTSYVRGVRIDLTAQAHTYTATKDTYVYINVGGFYNFSENSTGSTSDSNAPTPAADNLLLAKVVTSGTAITSVTDSRVMAIQVSTTSTTFPADYRNQAFVSRDSSTTFHVEPGNVAIGNTSYVRTSDTSTKTLSTNSNWIEGTFPTGTNTKIFVYAYNDTGTSWDFKFSSADPVYSDSSSNTGGVLRYYTSGGTTYRAIGWAYLSADQVQSYEFGNFKDHGISNVVVRAGTNDISTTVASYTEINSDIKFYSSGSPLKLYFNGPIGTTTGVSVLGNLRILLDGNEAKAGFYVVNSANPSYSTSTLETVAYPVQGLHTIKLQWKANGGGQMHQRGSTDAPRELSAQELG